jgi:hypothetical protein
MSRSFVSSLYRTARIANDVRAASRGPLPLAKRLVRKRVYAKSAGLTGRLLRTVGMQK